MTLDQIFTALILLGLLLLLGKWLRLKVALFGRLAFRGQKQEENEP
jgi:glutamate:Na+ symporter, ESS family